MTKNLPSFVEIGRTAALTCSREIYRFQSFLKTFILLWDSRLGRKNVIEARDRLTKCIFAEGWAFWGYIDAAQFFWVLFLTNGSKFDPYEKLETNQNTKWLLNGFKKDKGIIGRPIIDTHKLWHYFQTTTSLASLPPSWNSWKNANCWEMVDARGKSGIEY